VSGLMGDLAKGIKAFKRTMAEDDHATQHHLEQAEDHHPETQHG